MAVSNPLERRITRALIKAAVGKKITCRCGVVLDCRDVVLLTFESGASVDCGSCFDKALEESGLDAETLQIDGYEVADGRVWFK